MPVLGVVLLYAGFKLTWLGLASLREGPAGAPAYGRYYLTGHCTVNPVTVTGLSMPTRIHRAQALIGTTLIYILGYSIVRVLRFCRAQRTGATILTSAPCTGVTMLLFGAGIF